LILFWCQLSDRVGRRLVLCMGALGSALSILCFGFSKSLFTMIVSRTLLGALNGNAGVIKSAISDVTDESNRARAFSIIPAGVGIPLPALCDLIEVLVVAGMPDRPGAGRLCGQS
jgi:MFS family permease